MIALTPMLLSTIQGYHCAREAVLDAAKARLSQLAVSRRARIELWLTERLADAAFLAACPNVRNRGHEHGSAESNTWATSNFLRLFADKYGIYETIALYDLSWRELASVGVDDHGLGDFELSKIKETVENSPGPAVGRIHRHQDCRLGMHFGAPVLGAGLEPIGYILTAVDEAAVLTALNEGIPMTTTGRCYITSSDGLVLTEPDDSMHATALTQMISTQGFLRGRAGETGAAVYDDFLGREVVGGFTAIPSMDWVLLIEQDAAHALSWLPRLGWRAGITAVLVTVLVVLLAFGASRRMTTPLQKLVTVANQVAMGEHGARVEPVAEPEVDAVGRALNHMLDELASTRRTMIHQATLAALGEMSSAVVHEMRNPLCSIKLNLQALRASFKNDPTHSELASIAQDQVKRLEDMFTDMLSLSRPLVMNLQEMELHDAVEMAFEDVADKARVKRCRLLIEDNAPGAIVKIDPTRFGQALVNLLQNALESIEDDGEIVARIALDDTGRRVVLEILDNGPGIPEDNLQRLFQPFFTTKSDGTGLGLSIVRKTVEYHSGQITARNRTRSDGRQSDGRQSDGRQSDGRPCGAAFRIELPLYILTPSVVA